MEPLLRCLHRSESPSSKMGPSHTSSDQLDPEAGPTWRERFRSLARIFSLVSLSSFLLASLSLMRPSSLSLMRPYGDGAFVTVILISFVFLVMSMVIGMLARQWIYAYITVGIIATIGVFVVPAMLRCRHCGSGEAAPVANLRTINTAEVTYLSGAGSYGTMKNLIDAELLDDKFTGTKAGYNYTITLDETGSHYTAEAVPAPVVEAARVVYISRFERNSSLWLL
jgi:hypothetical protein